MLHFNVRRLTAAVALVLVLAAAPALAAPAPRPHVTQPQVASLLDRLLDWLGFAAQSLPGQPGRHEKTTTGTAGDPGTFSTTRTTLNRGAMVDPNG